MRPVLLLSIALVAALFGAGCGAIHRSAAGPVPWVNRPLPRYEIPPPKLIPYPASASPCRGSDLRVREGRGGAAAGTLYQRLVFTNVGARTCLLRGYPTISALTSSGARVSLHPRRAGLTFFYLVPADLTPGGHSFIGLATGDACDNGTRKATIYRRLRLTTSNGEIINAAPDVRVTEACGLFLSSFGRPARYTPRSPRPGTPETATVRARVPASVRAGTVLHYTITLSNPTKTTIVLKPCPGYSEGIYASGLIIRRSLALNCDSVQKIGPHEHVAFAMELTVPRSAPTGVSKFSWSLNDPNGPFAGGIITVTAPR